MERGKKKVGKGEAGKYEWRDGGGRGAKRQRKEKRKEGKEQQGRREKNWMQKRKRKPTSITMPIRILAARRGVKINDGVYPMSCTLCV